LPARRVVTGEVNGKAPSMIGAILMVMCPGGGPETRPSS
jgi:hypothetical protein